MAQRGLSSGGTRRGGLAARPPGARPGPAAEGRADEALALHQLGVVQAHADPPDVAQAEAHYQQALALAEELGMRPLQAHCHHGLGRLYHQTGRAEQARAALSTAIDLYRAMDMTFWLPQAEAARAEGGGRPWGWGCPRPRAVPRQGGRGLASLRGTPPGCPPRLASRRRARGVAPPGRRDPQASEEGRRSD